VPRERSIQHVIARDFYYKLGFSIHVVFTSYSCFVRLILIAMASGDQNTTLAALAARLLAHVSQQQSSNPSPAGPSNGTTSTNPQNNKWDGVVLCISFDTGV